MSAAAKTVSTYFDPGWIASEQVGTNTLIHYDYNGKGQQTCRRPASACASDTTNAVFWSYRPDSRLLSRSDQQGQQVSYGYDADGNLVSSRDASGLTDPSQTPIDTQNAYDDLDRLVRSDLKPESSGSVSVPNWTFSSFAYDLNGNVTDQDQNGLESSPNGVVVKDGHKLHSDYDQANWLIDQIDSTLNQQILNSFTPIGLESSREIDQSNGSGGWNLQQKTTWSYFANGQLSGLTTSVPSQTACTTPCTNTQIIESHKVSYLDTNPNFANTYGVYVDGNRTKDQYILRPGGSASSPCFPPASPGTCTATYGYDPRDRLVQNIDGHGDQTNYTLDGAGNIQKQVQTTPTGTTTVSNTYDPNNLNQLQQSATSGGPTLLYWYDSLGRQQCVTDTTGSRADCNPSENASGNKPLLQDYKYDYLDRLQTYRTYPGGGSPTDEANYVYDALNRTVQETEQHPSFPGDKHITQFSYLGLGGLETEEQQTSKNSGNTLWIKDFTYDIYGHRLAMTVSGSTVPGVPNGTFTYGYDVHGSVSQLVDANGNTTASYGYTPYGQQDSTLSQGENADKTNPINPFRYSAKRADTGSGSIDMGVRRFGPDTAHFLTPDFFYGSLADLSLSIDSLTDNRYDLAGGNPISFKEWDGHMVLADGGGGAATAPIPQEAPAPAPAPTPIGRTNDAPSERVDPGGLVKGVWQRAQRAWDETTSAARDKLNELRRQAQEKLDQAKEKLDRANEKLNQVKQQIQDEAGQLKEAVEARIRVAATDRPRVQVPQVKRPPDEPIEGEGPLVLPIALPWQLQAKKRTWKCTVRCNLYPLPNCPDPSACNRNMEVQAQGNTQGDCKRAGENAIRAAAGALGCGTRHCHVIRFWQ